MGSPGGGPPSSRDAPHLRVHAVNIFVRDQDRSLRFYVEQLGFDVAFDARLQSGERWVAVAPPDGSAMLRLIEAKPDSKQSGLIGRPTGVVFVTDNVIAKYGEWSKRGVRFRYTPRLRRVVYGAAGRSEAGAQATGADHAWGGVFTHFEDIDGNIFALVGFDEVTRQIEAQRRSIAERREAERRAEHELAIATAVQSRLFPQRAPAMTTLEYAGACLQARQVGGDYYDFLDLGESRLGLVIGDISGKGIAAALLMANLQANIRSQSGTAVEDPRKFLRCVNQLFYKNTIDSAYATLFYAEYDDWSRSVRYANCGHLPAIIIREGEVVDRLGSTGTVLGLFEEWDCGLEARVLAPGDMIAIYTDGVTEAFNDAGEEFGDKRLVDALRGARSRCPEGVIDVVLADIRQFSSREQHDDITLIVARSR
jgi:serine phosphatase RsbU (regulator of sigma subunit)/predicted enzyme related to lactoylglutathione lyase